MEQFGLASLSGVRYKPPILKKKICSARFLIVTKKVWLPATGVNEAVKQERILVPLGPHNKDLKGVHHALALAERMQASVYILLLESLADRDDLLIWVQEALQDLINNAREAGLAVSYHIAKGSFEEEVLAFILEEGIDLIVFGGDEAYMAPSLLRIKSRAPVQIIQVKRKDNVNYL
jgi:K+-sensing histidine kinase KdpD